jgi:hypothetical protein
MLSLLSTDAEHHAPNEPASIGIWHSASGVELAMPFVGKRGRKPARAAARFACLEAPDEYILNILMPTSVHIPKDLLVAVDRRAKQLGMSRNRFIVRALERDISKDAEWSPGFFEKFSPLNREDATALDETFAFVRANRKSKKPPTL